MISVKDSFLTSLYLIMIAPYIERDELLVASESAPIITIHHKDYLTEACLAQW